MGCVMPCVVPCPTPPHCKPLCPTAPYHQQNHSLDVDFLIISLIIQLRRHELWGANHTQGCRHALEQRGKPQVTYLQLPSSTIDKHIVTLEVPGEDTTAVRRTAVSRTEAGG